MKTLGDAIKSEIRKHKTSKNTFGDFPIGSRVRVINPCVDLLFFRGTETGVVTRNDGKYLGIIVKFDTPMLYEDGYKRETHNFSPKDLIVLSTVPCKHCGK